MCPQCRYILRGLDAPKKQTPAPTTPTPTPHPPQVAEVAQATFVPDSKENFSPLPVLQHAIVLWKVAFLPLMLLAAIGQLWTFPLSLVFSLSEIPVLEFDKYTPTLIAGGILALFLGLPLHLGSNAGAIVFLDRLVRRSGDLPTPWQAFTKSLPSFWRLLSVSLITWGISALIAAPAVVAWLMDKEAAASLLTMAAISAIIYFQVHWIAIHPIVMLEGLKNKDVLARSSALVRGKWLSVFAVMAVFTGVNVLTMAVVGALGEMFQFVLQVSIVVPLYMTITYTIYLKLLSNAAPSD